MSMKTAAAFLAWMLFIPCAVQAAAPAEQEENSCHTAVYNACMDKSEGVTIAMVECMEAERIAIQSKIEKFYKEVVAQQNEERNAALKSAVQDWKKYRTSMGGYIYDSDGGSAARINSLSWALGETNRLCVLLTGFIY